LDTGALDKCEKKYSKNLSFASKEPLYTREMLFEIGF